MHCIQKLQVEDITFRQVVCALLVASRLESLATGQPTEYIQRGVAELDGAIQMELVRFGVREEDNE